MSDTISLAVGDAYSIKHTDYTFDIEITGLSTRFVTYMATGSDVKDPDRPRTMDIPVFARWMTGLDAIGGLQQTRKGR